MPYSDVLNDHVFGTYYVSKFYSIASVNALQDQLRTVDFSVVASRRDGRITLNEFVASGVLGEKLFSEDRRFPHGISRLYFVSADLFFNGWITDVATVLSYRETNAPKDVQLSSGNEQESVLRETANQDSTVKFSALLKQLDMFKVQSSLVWSRQNFETKIAGVRT
uniref:Coat protein n=1 Tax=Agaricus bisporus virus 6 TaxID=1945750 RepID=A0A1Q1M962_9VIRU|nr:coat protein [Agaricus bisporus virus 6]